MYLVGSFASLASGDIGCAGLTVADWTSIALVNQLRRLPILEEVKYLNSDNIVGLDIVVGYRMFIEELF